MNWHQIENNWAAMTRRVRPDWTAPAAANAADDRADSGAAGDAPTLIENSAAPAPTSDTALHPRERA